MKKIKVEIEGTAPLLMNRYNIEIEKQRQKGRKTTLTYDHKEQAKNSAYWKKSGKKELCIPSEILYAATLKAASFYKIRKRSASSIIAGSIRFDPFEIGLGTKNYEIDIRPVVIQKARILRARAKIPKWKAKFSINYNETLIGNPEILKDILTEAGERIGIMDFRPSKKGPFGTFKITKWHHD